MVSRGIRLKISSRICSVSMLRASIGIESNVMQGRNRQVVIALNVEALAAVCYRPDQYGFPRPIIIAWIRFGSFLANVAFEQNEIKGGRGELADLAVLLM